MLSFLNINYKLSHRICSFELGLKKTLFANYLTIEGSFEKFLNLGTISQKCIIYSINGAIHPTLFKNRIYFTIFSWYIIENIVYQEKASILHDRVLLQVYLEITFLHCRKMHALHIHKLYPHCQESKYLM